MKKSDTLMINSDIDLMEDKLIFFKLKKINIMKTIIDTLDKMVSEVDWIFTSKQSNNSDKDNEFIGLEIICTDPSKTLYTKVKLNSELFKSYYCSKPIMKFGMSLEYFNKILRLTEKDDIAIYCYIEQDDPNNLVIRFKNQEKKNKKIFKIPLQIVETNIKPPIALSFEKKISIKPETFISHCKMIGNTSQFVEIEVDSDKIFFKCVGDNKEGILTLDSNDDTTLEIINLNNNIVKGIYEIKNILLFSKLVGITENFSIFIKNNFALTTIYSLGDYGTISTILSPVNQEHINNKDYEYSDEEDDDIELINTNSNFIDM